MDNKLEINPKKGKQTMDNKLEKIAQEFWSLVPNESFYDDTQEMLERRQAYIKELEIALFGKSLEKEL